MYNIYIVSDCCMMELISVINKNLSSIVTLRQILNRRLIMM